MSMTSLVLENYNETLYIPTKMTKQKKRPVTANVGEDPVCLKFSYIARGNVN